MLSVELQDLVKIYMHLVNEPSDDSKHEVLYCIIILRYSNDFYAMLPKSNMLLGYV